MNSTPRRLPAERSDLSFARRRMVDAQVRAVGVSDPRLLELMRELPRERFVPPDRAELAYMDDDVPLGGGRVLMEPRIIARLLQVLVPRRGETALVVGAGAGYGTCLLRRLGLEVVALEADPALLSSGRTTCAELAPGVEWREGPLAAGVPGGTGFDVVLVEGAVQAPPDGLAPQLAVGGRLAGVLMSSPWMGRAFVAEAVNGRLAVRPQFDATTALLPGFGSPPLFRF